MDMALESNGMAKYTLNLFMACNTISDVSLMQSNDI